MATVVNHLQTLKGAIDKYGHGFLFTADNRLAAGTLTTSAGGPVEPGLYAPGDLHHHVLTRRPLGNRWRKRNRPGRLVLAAYDSAAVGGVLRYRPVWQFDLSLPIQERPVKGRDGAFQPLPGYRGLTTAIARLLVDAVVAARTPGRLDPDLRMARAVTEADDAKIAYDTGPVEQLALQAANGRKQLADCIVPVDCRVVSVITGYQDRQLGTESPRTLVHLRPAAATGPLDEVLDGDVVVQLPERCQLIPELVLVANREIDPGTLELAAGTLFARPLAAAGRAKWAQACAELGDPEMVRWLQERAVAAEAAYWPEGMRPADLQTPGGKLLELVTEKSPVVRVCDVGYNPARKLTNRDAAGTADAFDLWTLAGGKDEGDGDRRRADPGQH